MILVKVLQVNFLYHYRHHYYRNYEYEEGIISTTFSPAVYENLQLTSLLRTHLVLSYCITIN